MGSRLFDAFNLIWTDCISRVHQQIYLLREHPDRREEALKMTRETLQRVTESTQAASFDASVINPLHVLAVKAALRAHYFALSIKSDDKEMIESLQILGHFMQNIRHQRSPANKVVEQDLRRAMEGMEVSEGSERTFVTHDLLHAMEAVCIYDPANPRGKEQTGWRAGLLNSMGKTDPFFLWLAMGLLSTH
ncbi:hypothetical protein N7492_008432 [Penicillium capsulatum]|uniref:Uncharacterized protein n=1 Tax=Penicillium capsulatum TaxID=69766 RepID=A0A9W9HVA3_9EURO|nr:hypothetical protein N7492_008432 [Penicillium capsulatum]KAJ6105834.1 hypothetical protein N7512_009351 [Penicillium capsulatum]